MTSVMTQLTQSWQRRIHIQWELRRCQRQAMQRCCCELQRSLEPKSRRICPTRRIPKASSRNDVCMTTIYIMYSAKYVHSFRQFSFPSFLDKKLRPWQISLAKSERNFRCTHWHKQSDTKVRRSANKSIDCKSLLWLDINSIAVSYNTNHYVSKQVQLQQLLLLYPFNRLFSRTTWVSWYHKGKPVWI